MDTKSSLLRGVRLLILVGLLAVAGYSLQLGFTAKMLSVGFVSLLLAGACLLAGGLLGFLFGLPRTVQGSDGSDTNGAGQASASDGTGGIRYRANTNLEQISDWLTKILVGVGLTQIPQIAQGARDLITYLVPGFSGIAGSQAFILAILVFFTISGFLGGFLWTRLELAGALRSADATALNRRIETVERTAIKAAADVKLQLNQQQIDVQALSLTEKQLVPDRDQPPVAQEQLDSAVPEASAPVKLQIFTRARLQRAANWKIDKKRMSLTIPIFRALISADKENHFHRNHGQLGYALKDQETPDWSGALAELGQAITIRGDWRQTGWRFYEFNRAICRIQLDLGFKAGQASRPDTKDAIVADLKVAVTNDQIRPMLVEHQDISRWMGLNQVTLEALAQDS